MTEQLMDALCAVREALDIPKGASARATRIRSTTLAGRADQVVALLQACTAGEDVAAEVAELRVWLEHHPIGYVRVEQAGGDLPNDGPTYVLPGSVLALPRAGLPAWVGTHYLARLWRVHQRTVGGWADGGLLTCVWQEGARRFASQAVEEFARDAISVRLLAPGMVVQHPQWAAGMPVRIVSTRQADRGLWHVTYRLHSDETGGSGTELVAAGPARGTRIVLRYRTEGSTCVDTANK